MHCFAKLLHGDTHSLLQRLHVLRKCHCLWLAGNRMTSTARPALEKSQSSTHVLKR